MVCSKEYRLSVGRRRRALFNPNVLVQRSVQLIWVLHAKDWTHIHTLMQDSDDLDVLTTSLLIKNNMASLWKLSVAISDFIARFTNVRVFSE